MASVEGQTLYIRLDSNHAVPIKTYPTWNVMKLKEEIAKKSGIGADDINVIFLGKELKDETTLEEYEFDNHTILHAVKGRRSKVKKVSLRFPNRSQDPGLNAISEVAYTAEHGADLETGSLRAQFYVYCKPTCKSIQPGKLRVRCNLCKQGTLIFDRDPSNWDDVLVKGAITGKCQSNQCDGNVAEFYFKCKAHDSLSDDTAVALHHIKTNVNGAPCITCLEIMNPVLVFNCAVQHSMCLDCFHIYCTTKLNDRHFVHSPTNGYTLGCPASCDNSHITEVHHFRVLEDVQYERYQRFGAEECVLQSGGVLCPAPGCGAGLILDDDDVLKITCEECEFVFCRECKERYHDGDCARSFFDTVGENAKGYLVDPENREKAQWDRASKETIQKTTKSCPKCKVPTEKAGGCMHMSCSRCNYQWCWQCNTEWNRDCQGDHWFD